MKENWMEKFIELLNEHIEENTWQKYYLNERDVKNKLDSLLILRYFIKWLVDNDKIDFNKVEKNLTFQECLWILVDRWYYTNVVLMLLSIQDNPIEFLISILK